MPPAQGRDHPGREREPAVSALRLGLRLVDQTLPLDADNRGSDLDPSLVEVHRTPGETRRLADSDTGAHQEVHELRDVPADGHVVVGQEAAELPQLLDRERAGRFLRCRTRDGPGVPHDVAVDGIVPCRHADHPRQHRARLLGRRRPVLVRHERQEPIHDTDRQLAHPQGAETGGVYTPLMAKSGVFVDAVRERATQGRLIMLCGAGVSSALCGGERTSTWIGLIENGCNFLGSLGPAYEAESQQFLQIIQGKPSTPMLVAAAEWLRGTFRRLGEGEYKSWLQRTVGQLKVQDSEIARPMASVDTILTTSYDHLLEASLEREPLTWTDGDRIDEFYDEPGRFIFHLHGHYRAPKSVVLGGTDYGRLESAPTTFRILEALARQQTYLVAGFGAGLDDPNFSGFMDWFNAEMRTWPERIYVLVRGDQEKMDLSEGLREKTAFLPYGNSYSDLPAYLSELLVGGGKSPAAKNVLPGPTGKDSLSTDVAVDIKKVLPSQVFSKIEERLGPIADLTDFQREVLAVAGKLIQERGAGLVSAVTGTGKTTLSRAAMHLAIAQHGAAAMLLPTKALVTQEVNEWEEWISAWDEADRKIAVYGASRDYPEHDSPVSKGQFDVAIAIYEKLGIYLVNGRRPLAHTRILIVDELQTLVEDRERAMKLEGLLTMIRLIPPDSRPAILALSATLSEESTSLLRQWLSVDKRALVMTSQRPIPLDTYVLDAVSQRVQPDSHLITLGKNVDNLPEPIDSRHEIGQDLRTSNVSTLQIGNLSTGALAAVLVQSLLVKDSSRRILVFVPGRTAAQELATAIQRLLNKSLGTPPRQGSPWSTGRFANHSISQSEAEQRYISLNHSDLPLSEDVVRGMRQGVAYHSARLPASLRRQLEQEFRDQDGILRVLVATDTLAIGVNLPADTVIATSIGGYSDAGLQLLTPSELDNKAGRAGRRGQMSRERGEFYILVPEQRDLERLGGITAKEIRTLSTLDGVFANYVRNSDRTPKIVAKYTELDDIAQLVLQILCADGFSRKPEALHARTESILGGLLAAQDPTVGLPSADDVLARLTELRLIARVNAKCGPSRLGTALGRSGLSIAAASTLERLSRLATQGAGDIDLLYNAFRSREIEKVTAWVSLPDVQERHYPSLKEYIISYALSYCAETEARRFDCSRLLLTGKNPLPDLLVRAGSKVVSENLRELLRVDAEEVSNKDATALLRALVAFEWLKGIPFLELKARFSMAIRSDENRPREKPVELKLHYSDVEQICEQVAGVIRGAAELSFAQSGLDYSSRMLALALQVEVGLPAWLAPIAKLRLPQLHRNRLAFLWASEPRSSGWGEILDMPELRDHPGLSLDERTEARRELELKEQRERFHRHRVTQQWSSLVIPGMGGTNFDEFGDELDGAADGNVYLELFAELGSAIGAETVVYSSSELFGRSTWSAGEYEVTFLAPHGPLAGKTVEAMASENSFAIMRTRLEPSAYQALSSGGTRCRFVQPEQLLSLVARFVDSRAEGVSAEEILEAMNRIRVSALESDSWSMYYDEQPAPPPFAGDIPPLSTSDRQSPVIDENIMP